MKFYCVASGFSHDLSLNKKSRGVIMMGKSEYFITKAAIEISGRHFLM